VSRINATRSQQWHHQPLWMEGSERLDHKFCWRFFEIVVIVIRCLHFSRRFSDGGDSPVKDVRSYS
jgi:hypothetical protein